jgi:hypothetical protein
MTLRIGLALAAAGAVIILVWFALHEREEAARERARADGAVAQSNLNTDTATIADRVGSDRVIIIQKAEETAHAVEAIPSDDIPANVLVAWRAGLRDSASGPDTEHPGELPADVQEPQP